MGRYLVEYYMATTQCDEVEADCEETAEALALSDLAHQHDLCGRPTDMIYGVRSVELLEPDETEE